jgi:hypothetical protein
VGLQVAGLEALSLPSTTLLFGTNLFPQTWKKMHPKQSRSDQASSLLNLEKEEEELQGQGVN